MASIATPATLPSEKKHPYNIEIKGVMDKDGADAMVDRLTALGYPSYEVSTEIEGETWYRVRVGPYASEDQAKVAQEQLRNRYKAKYASP